ncbi:MAG: PAS domain S-box protein [Anaerolineae bacterium]|nr:PAS domain S-box protein [Anaerolineae bacterium]
MSRPLRVLIVEDSEDDTLLLLRELRRGGYDPTYERVETAEAMRAALAGQSWEIVIADYSLPHFSAPAALALLQASGLDLPFIIVSGTVGEETAVAAMKAGAHDYLMKGQLARLVPAIERELREAEGRRERRRAEEALRASEGRFRALIEHAADGIALLNPEGTLRYVSPSTRQILGYSSEELVGRDPVELIHPDDRDYITSLLLDLTQKPGDISTACYRVQHKDGSWRWIETTINNLLAEPSVQGIGFNYRDITERKRAEEALRESEARFSVIFEHANDAIHLDNADDEILAVNSRLVELTGYSREELLKMRVSDLQAPELRGQPGHVIRNELARYGNAPFETLNLRRNGQRIPVEISVGYIESAQGDLYISIVRDITQRKQAEAALHESMLFNQAVLNSLTANIVVLNDQGVITAINEAWEEFARANGDPTLARTGPGVNYLEVCRQATGPEAPLAQAALAGIQAVMSGTESHFSLEYDCHSPNEQRWFMMRVTPLRNGRENVVIAHEYITERKRAELELEQRAVQLALINSISAQVTAVLELDRLLDQSAFLIHHMFDYHHVALFLSEEEVLKLKAVAGLYAPYFPAGHTQGLDQGIIGRVATSGLKIVANDVGQDPYFTSLIAAHSITRSELCIPLSIAGQTIGVLDIQSPNLNGFGQNDVIAMEALAHQLAGAIANARLYEQARQEISERQRVEQEISARNRELLLLNQIIAVSASGQDVEAILETTCSELARTFNMAQVTATLLDGEKSELVVAARYGATETGLPEIQNGEWLTEQGGRIPVDRHHPLVRHLLNLSGPLVAPEAQSDPRLASIREPLRRRGIVSVLIIPLRDEEDILGSLNLEAVEPRTFSSGEAALAWSVADQVAGALNRIRLERKRAEAEAEMRANEERFRQVVASVSDHIYMSEITGEGEHLNRYISPNVEELTGYGFEEFVRDASFWPEVVIYGEDRAAAAAQLSRLQQGENSEVEYRLVRADGQVIWVRDNGRVVAQGGSVLIYGVVSDVTERKQAEMALLEERALLAGRVTERTAELSAANAELARAARLKDEFLANMSHELRTPLNAILGMSEVLREHIYGPLNEKQLHAVGHIEEGGRHLLTLINDILDLSKIEAGKLELFMAPVSVENVCQASLRFIKQMAQKKRIEVTLALASPLGTLQADERRLKQILVNLLTNAVKFTPEGGQVRLEVGYEGGGEAIQFRVRDSGVGIAAEDMQRLFKPFVQLDSKLSRHHEGTGLGLSLVSRLTELHGGSVRVESQVGQGSQFTISLPCLGEGSPVEAVAHQPSGSPPAGLEKGSGQKRPLILLAEDNEANIETLRPYLGAKGYRLKVARNGSQAVQMAQEERPAVILMDIQMPVLDGLEAIRQLRANGHFAGVPIIALTALAMPGDRERCLAAGANEYLSKPVSLKSLVELISKMAP